MTSPTQIKESLAVRIFKILFILSVFFGLGLLSRPLLNHLIPGQQIKKMSPDLNRMYERAAMHESPMRNPVIVVPGMMGSKLNHTAKDRIVWGAFTSESIDPSLASDVRLLGVPIDKDVDFDNFDDGVYATSVLDTLKIDLAVVSLNQQAYLNILKMLGVGGYRDELLGLNGAVDYGEQHFTCFQFPYDWRRDNAENARRLHEFILQKKTYIEEERKKKFGVDEPVRFDIVAHSMGGLVSRYFLRYGNQGPATDGNPPNLDWSGCEFVDKLIMIGTPNSGSAKSLVSTHEGFDFSIIFKRFPSGLVATLPSIYQLLPNGSSESVFDSKTNQPIDLYDVEQWDSRNWGLLNPEQDSVLQMHLPDTADAKERRQIAKYHLAKCLKRAKNFHKALNIPAQPPSTTTIHLFAGDAIDTLDTLSSNIETKELIERTFSPGDGTVTRKSALGDQRTDQNWGPTLQSPVDLHDVRFLFDDHFGLTRDAEFTDNALFMLLEDPSNQTRQKQPVQ